MRGERGFRTHEIGILRIFAQCEISHNANFRTVFFFHSSSPLFFFHSSSAAVLLICRASFGLDSLSLVDSTNLALKTIKSHKMRSE